MFDLEIECPRSIELNADTNIFSALVPPKADFKFALSLAPCFRFGDPVELRQSSLQERVPCVCEHAV